MLKSFQFTSCSRAAFNLLPFESKNSPEIISVKYSFCSVFLIHKHVVLQTALGFNIVV